MLTSEERRVEIYASSDTPTISSAVNPGTSLEALNLNWREHELREILRTKHVHRLHPYLGKYIPQIVEVFLRKYFLAGQTVLDPFCGSGTTLVQANELGINAIGFDVSAFNVLLTRAKTAIYDLNKLSFEVHDILAKVRSQTQQQPSLCQPSPASTPVTDTDDPYLQAWFTPQSLRELLNYRWFVEEGDYEYKDLLRIILSRAARSARIAPHYELDFPKTPQTLPYWCFKHSRTCVPTNGAFKFLDRYSLDSLRRVKEYSQLQTPAMVCVRHADSRYADVPQIDGVITSPPYVGLIDYHEQHTYAYRLLGLPDERENEIGAAVEGAAQAAREKYQRLIASVFRKAVLAMPSGGRLIVVAGDKRHLYPQIAQEIGVEVEAVVQRHVNRRTGRRSTDFYESVFIWRVP